MALKVCKDCVNLIEDPHYQGPARYVCRVGMRMYPNLSRRFHTAREMRDGACGRDARFYQESESTPAHPLKVKV